MDKRSLDSLIIIFWGETIFHPLKLATLAFLGERKKQGKSLKKQGFFSLRNPYNPWERKENRTNKARKIGKTKKARKSKKEKKKTHTHTRIGRVRVWSTLKFRIGFPFGENSAGFCKWRPKSVWLPGSILNFRIGSVSSIGGLMAATLFAATILRFPEPRSSQIAVRRFFWH